MKNTYSWLIYCHINKINGKRYIGLTKHSNNPNQRWANGKSYPMEHHRLFAAAIQKYGWDAFEHCILESSIATIEEANQREQYWIAYYHTYIKDPLCWGYNLTIGGDGGRGRIMSDAEKEYRRQLKLGTKASEETKRKMSETRKGKKQNMTPKKVAACQKAAAAMSASRRKKIYCIETNTIFESITAAAQDVGVAETTIGACLHGRQKTAGGYHWKYLEGDLLYDPVDLEKRSKT